MATKYRDIAKSKMLQFAEDGILDAVVFCVQFDAEKYLAKLKTMAETEEDPEYAFVIWKKLFQVAPEVKDTGYNISFRKEFNIE